MLPTSDCRARARNDTLGTVRVRAAHPRHLVISHARTVIVDRGVVLGLALRRPAYKGDRSFFFSLFFLRNVMEPHVEYGCARCRDEVGRDGDIVKAVSPNGDGNTYFLCELLLGGIVASCLNP